MRVLVAGAGSTTSRIQPPAAFILEHDGHLLGIECPSPIPYALAHAGGIAGVDVDVLQVDWWFITHPHGAASAGLEAVGLERRALGLDRPTVVAGPDVMDALRRGYKSSAAKQQIALDGSPAPIEVNDVFAGMIVEQNDVVECGPFMIEARPVVHTLPAYAVRVTAGVKSFAYSSKTLFDEMLLDCLAGADVFAHSVVGGVSADFDQLRDALSPDQAARCLLVHHDRMTQAQRAAATEACFTLATAGSLFEA